MSFDPVTALLDLGKTAIDKIFPDAESKQKRIAELERMAHEGNMEALSAEVKLLQGQLEINKEEAKHNSLFVAGWRPAVGWTCVAIFVFNYIVLPLLEYGALAFNSDFPIPDRLAPAQLLTVLGGMLGIGGYRSFDKVKGVDTKRFG